MEFTKYRLGDIADIKISGVDKKTTPGEQSVRLCNFVDVYRNWAINKELYDSFMVATANDNEISDFTIHKGQVAITKDSETRDDIGIATYISDDFEEPVVLGYHTALITPNEDIILGKYLNALLHTKYFHDYWYNNASGSGMRYTLSELSMRNAVVLLPSINTQRIASGFLSSIDKKIAINRRINERLEGMAKLLYDYWFVQFEFPNEEGKPYKSSGGKMVWNEKLKREIPEGWEVKKIGDITKDDLEQINPSDNPDKLYRHFSIPAYDTNHYYTLERGKTILSDKYVLTQDDIIVSKLNPWVSRVIWGMDLENAICSTEFVSLTPINNVEKGFVYFCAKSLPFISYCTKASTGTSHSHRRVNPNIMRKYPIPYNHEVLSKFSSMVNPLAEMIMMNLENNYCLTEVRDFLLPMLMNGQVEIKEK